MTDRAPISSPEGGPESGPAPELLAPAGDWAALEAALEAGASAVYLGLTTLNARRWARNFLPAELVRAVETAHARGARVHLTLNVDLSERELGPAARILELARQCHADAVLVRDPALLALRPEYPELEFHFSTQTCMAGRADVEAAGELGAARVVLARELTLDEIAAASSVPGVQTEVFVQGALCFSVSGRCLLSSWVGGRSGNRGTCTSPCRVPWSVAGHPAAAPLAMHDLATVHRLDELRRAGVAALKIEGRLKNAAWVRRAVALYRCALDHQHADPNELLEEARQLGAYTGRAVTCGYLDGQRDGLTGVAGRPAAEDTDAAAAADADAAVAPDAAIDSDAASDRGAVLDDGAAVGTGQPELTSFDLELHVAELGIACRCTCGGRTTEWSMPKTVVRRAHKAVAIGPLLDWLATREIRGCRLGRSATNAPEFLLVPRAVNAMVARISAAIRLGQKGPDDQVRIELPPRVREVLAGEAAAAANRHKLGDPPDRARLDVPAVAPFLKYVRPAAVIIEGLTPRLLPRVRAVCGRASLIVALPPVFFDGDAPELFALAQACAEARLPVEVNSWGGWRLAKEAGACMEGGPGLPVLNSLAARVLAGAGVGGVTLSIEADRRQLEDLTAHCPVPCSLVVYGRPPLMITRARLAEEKSLGLPFSDRRGVTMVPRREHGLWVFRPAEPFDLRGATNDRIRVSHLVVDLVGSQDPVGDWYDVPEPTGAFRFNYDRTLV